jgi:hypothetical protein
MRDRGNAPYVPRHRRRRRCGSSSSGPGAGHNHHASGGGAEVYRWNSVHFRLEVPPRYDEVEDRKTSKTHRIIFHYVVATALFRTETRVEFRATELIVRLSNAAAAVAGYNGTAGGLDGRLLAILFQVTLQPRYNHHRAPGEGAQGYGKEGRKFQAGSEAWLVRCENEYDTQKRRVL